MFTTPRPLPRFTDSTIVARFGDTAVEITDWHAFVTTASPEAGIDIDADDADYFTALDYVEYHGINTLAGPVSEHHVEGVLVGVYPR